MRSQNGHLAFYFIFSISINCIYSFTVFKTVETKQKNKKEIPLKLAFDTHKHKETEDFVKRLEYIGKNRHQLC